MTLLFEETNYWMKNVEARPRLYPSQLSAMMLGYFPKKTGRLEVSFFTCNFSFILSGEGDYRNSAGEWKVVAPCVLMQWPGEEFSYGPAQSTLDSDPEKSWEEFYIMYDTVSIPRLKELGFYRIENPVWHLNNTAAIHRRLNEIHSLCCHDNTYGMADRVDRICEELILESLLNEYVPEDTAHDEAFEAIFAEVEARFLEPIDFEQIADQIGISLSTFRRQWKKRLGIPPARYLMERRLQHASHLLIDTNLPVGTIADLIFFNDHLYFSRKFRAFSGFPPTEFRKRYRRH